MMDDHFEKPTFTPSKPEIEDENAESSGDEGGPDWTKFKPHTSTSRLLSLPKRGDKEFEPAESGPTDLQKFSLDRSRQAMFCALEAERDVSNKSVSYAVWYPDLARAEVYQARGVLFNGMGHSVPRPVQVDGETKMQRRMELLPEETLYLIERGSLFCWKDIPMRASPNGEESTLVEHRARGAPMSVQQAYVEMIGRENLTLNRYHAYAYLKRLGFNVIRSEPPSSYYPTSAPLIPPPKPSLASRLLSPFAAVLARVRHLFYSRMDWWRPLNFNLLFGCARNYPSLYRALRFIPSGHTCALRPPPSTSDSLSSPYEIFYHVYKPNTLFKKSAPPAPDFSLVVVNAKTTPLPTIHELTHLWSFLPETGPPAPRQKRPQQHQTKPTPQPPSTPPSPFFIHRFLHWLLGTSPPIVAEGTRKPHPFALLKAGKKTIVIGVVDSGTVGFFRFGMGAFEEVPMI